MARPSNQGSAKAVGITRAEYSRRCGVSRKTVSEWVRTGVITLRDDDTIDPEQADLERKMNQAKPTNAGGRKAQAAAPAEADAPGNRSGNILGNSADQRPHSTMTLLEAQTQKTAAQAHLAALDVREREGELVEREVAAEEVFGWFRRERDAWVAWPARISAQLAADLKIDHRTLHLELEKYVRQHLRELAEAERPEFRAAG